MNARIHQLVQSGIDARINDPALGDPATVGSPWFTETEAAAYMRFTVAALRSARYEHRGPVFSKTGRSIRYHRDDLDAHLRAGRRTA